MFFDFIYIIKSHLMPRHVLSIQTSLYGDSAVLVDEELPLAIGPAVYGVGDLALAALIGIGGLERLQVLTDLRVLVDVGLDIRLLEQRLIVVDVTQLDDHPRVRDVVLVVVVVLALLLFLFVCFFSIILFKTMLIYSLYSNGVFTGNCFVNLNYFILFAIFVNFKTHSSIN